RSSWTVRMSCFEQMRRKRMAKRMRSGRLRDARGAQRLTHRTLKGLVAHMVAPLDAASRIDRAAVGRKDVLPAPVTRSRRVLSLQRLRQTHGAKAASEVA